jgi:hypothetical protein
MILMDYTQTSDFSGLHRLGNSSIDTGNNYHNRQSSNGGTDSASQATYVRLDNGWQSGDRKFAVEYIADKTNKEKLIMNHMVRSVTTGASQAPQRSEVVSKWVPSTASDIISKFQMMNGGTYADGSEVVVLGWDPTDTHTTNFWEELSSTSLSGSAGFLNSSQFTAKKYIWFQAYLKNSGSIQLEMKFGHGGTITTGTDYASRLSINGGTDNTLRVSKNSIQTEHPTSSPIFVNGFIVNNASNEKLCIMHEVIQNTATAGYAPERVEFVGKWADTTNQIDIIQMTDSGSGSFADGSTLKVWGSN